MCSSISRMGRCSILVIGLLGLVVGSAAVAEDVVEPKTKRAFAREESGLHLAGVGVRTKLFIKVYGVGFYVEPEEARRALADFRGVSHEELSGNDRFYSRLVGTGFSKAMVLQFVYNAGTKRTKDSFREGIETNLPGMSPAGEEFLALFTGELGKKGDRMILRTDTTGRIVVLSNGKELGVVQDEALTTALWKIWLGPEPILPKLKADLVQLLPPILE